MDWTQVGLFALASTGGGVVAYAGLRVTLALLDKRVSDLEVRCAALEVRAKQIEGNHVVLDMKLVTEMSDIKATLARIEGKLEGRGK